MISHIRCLRRWAGFPALATIAALLSACGGPPTEADVKQALNAKQVANVTCGNTADKEGGYLCTFLTENVQDTARLKYESGAWHAYDRFDGGQYTHDARDTPENRDKVTNALRSIFEGVSQASVTPMDLCHFDVGLSKGHRIFNLTKLQRIVDGNVPAGSGMPANYVSLLPTIQMTSYGGLHCAPSGECETNFSITGASQDDFIAARKAGTVIMSVCNPAALR